MELPKHIADAVVSNKTSLGDHPSFPPKPTPNEYIMNVLASRYASLKNGVNGKSDDDVVKELNELFAKCLEEEKKSHSALEQLCADLVNDMFRIPEDTIDVKCHLTDTIDTSKERMVPEEDENYSFEDIDDIKYLGDEVYKRRLLNALVEGASEEYAYNVSNYVQELYKINPELPSLYSKIIRYSNYLMYALDDIALSTGKGADGTVEVMLNAEPKPIKVESYGTLFPIMLQNTIKGLLEVAILKGLPDDKDKAYYVMKKSDFRMAEIWDSRLGTALWEQISPLLDEVCDTEGDMGLNFLFMEISLLDTSRFNKFMQEVFAHTNKGKVFLEDLVEDILNKKDEEDFNNYIEQNNRLYPIEDGYFTEEDFGGEMPESY